jgi:lactate racemase
MPYGKEGMEVNLPEKNVSILRPPKTFEPPSIDLTTAALDHPIGSPSFQEVIDGKKSGLIAITDHQRLGAYQKEILSDVLTRLHGAGLKSIKILIARGSHTPSERSEWGEIYGAEAVKGHEVILHDPHSESNLVGLGATESGDPVTVNRAILEPDLVVGIGLIRPGVRPGYTGGAKLFAVGAAAYSTILSTHSPSVYLHPRTLVGNYHDHPFRERILPIARKAERASKAGTFFVINVVQQAGRTLDVFAGDMHLAWKKGCQFAQDLYEVSVPEPADILVCGGGFPLDRSAYVFTTLLTTICRSNPIPLVKKGGVVIALATLDQKPKEGSAEENFLRMVERIPYENAVERVKEIQGQAKTVSKDLEGLHKVLGTAELYNHTEGNIFIVGSKNVETVNRLRFVPFETLSAALDRACEIKGSGANILVVPNLNVISPYVGKPSS